MSQSPPDFYIGAPVDPDDLCFRGEFITEIHDHLRNHHLILSAPRRTGKTSVMDYLAAHPHGGFSPISVFVQDISHPADFILLLLDLFHEKHPKWFKDLFAKGSGLIGKVLGRVGEIEAQGFKVTLRQQEPDWRENWKKHGDEFFAQVRKSEHRLLLLVDEFPDMILNMQKHDASLVRPFLAWFRGHRLTPHPKQDHVRWLLCGSVNLSSTLDGIDCLDEINDLMDVALPPLTKEQVIEFVETMLTSRKVSFDPKVPAKVARELGRPVPVFLQMVTQDLYRMAKKAGKPLAVRDVSRAFADLIVTSGARDKLQHYYSRIDMYYPVPKAAAAYALLAKLAISPAGLSRASLFAEFEQSLVQQGDTSPANKRKQVFNQLLRDLENDFYVAEIKAGHFDFSSGLMKQWWRKYYA